MRGRGQRQSMVRLSVDARRTTMTEVAAEGCMVRPSPQNFWSRILLMMEDEKSIGGGGARILGWITSSIPSNRLAPWIFTCSIKRKLCLSLFNPSDTPLCPCSRHIDPFGNQIFQCPLRCKIGAHNAIHNGFATAPPHSSPQQASSCPKF